MGGIRLRTPQPDSPNQTLPFQKCVIQDYEKRDDCLRPHRELPASVSWDQKRTCVVRIRAPSNPECHANKSRVTNIPHEKPNRWLAALAQSYAFPDCGRTFSVFFPLCRWRPWSFACRGGTVRVWCQVRSLIYSTGLIKPQYFKRFDHTI